METSPLLGFDQYQARSDGSILRGGAVRRVTRKPGGYEEIVLYREGKRHVRYVHRLIWSAFNGEIPEGNHVNHIDGNKSNNALSNLECVTPAENYAHSKENCVHRGEEIASAKLTEARVREIRRRAASGEPIGDLAAEFAVLRVTIRKVVDRVSWAHVPDE